MPRDLSYAIRTILRDPGFTAVVVISVALGIAANTTVFSMVNATLLGALPVRDPGGLYSLSGGRTFPYPNYREFRDECAGVFSGLAAHFPLAPANLAGSGPAERVWGQLVSGNYFSVVAPPLALGRGISPDEDAAPGQSPVVVLGNALWRRRFGGDPNVIGKTVVLNGLSFTIIGVMAPGFHGTDRGILSEFWAPLAMYKSFVPDITDTESRTTNWISITGRLKPGVSREQAVSALNVVNARSETYKEGRRRDPVTLTPAGKIPGEAKGVGGLMAVLMVVVGLVLLIACANVANLLLARAVARQQEISLRMAMGASRWRLIRQLLTESVTLASLGAVGGFALAYFAADALSGLQLPIAVPIGFDFTPDLRVLLFTAVLAVVTGILFGLAPAIAASRTDLVSALKGAGGSFARFRRFGMRNILVGVQVTLSVVLLVAAGLFLRSLQSAASINLGIRPDNVLMLAVDPTTNNYSEERRREFLRQLEQRLTALPDVRSVAAVNIMPLSLAQNGEQFRDASKESSELANADVFTVTSRYFETVGIPLLRGRDFDPGRDTRNPTAIISELMARRLFGDKDPIGQRIAMRDGKEVFEVIGVSGDSKSVSLGEETKACVYTYLPNRPREIISLLGLTILVKTAGDPVRMLRPVREQVEALDRNLAIFNVDTLDHHVSKAFLIPRVCAALFGIFGLLGLVLASVGLYGVVSYSVRSRTREIGIRMALGAGVAGIIRLVIRQAMAIVAAGLALGLALALMVSRFTASLLYGISPTDAATFLGVPLVLLAAAVIAVVLPARRASRIEPMSALRFE
ncbi:MAG: ABC transporter permease [Rhodospirillales bacterium]